MAFQAVWVKPMMVDVGYQLAANWLLGNDFGSGASVAGRRGRQFWWNDSLTFHVTAGYFNLAKRWPQGCKLGRLRVLSSVTDWFFVALCCQCAGSILCRWRWLRCSRPLCIIHALSMRGVILPMQVCLLDLEGACVAFCQYYMAHFWVINGIFGEYVDWLCLPCTNNLLA